MIYAGIIVGFCFICYFGLGLGYYPDQDEFYFEITATDPFDLSNISKPIQVDSIYIGYSNDQNQLREKPRQILHFEIEDAAKNIDVEIDSEIASKINLQQNEMYHLTFQIVYGWPSSYSLMITNQMDELVFLGISDGEPNGVIDLYKLSPIEVQQTRILLGHLMPGRGCISKLTNTEVQFAEDGNILTLHQGQSGILNNYEIQLRVARKVNYTNQCYDFGMNQLSFVVYKTAYSIIQ